MGKPKQVGTIEVEEDLQFLKGEWRFQRIGWVVIALLLAASILGAFGPGPLSKRTVGDKQVFGAELSRIIRHAASDELNVFIGPGLQADSSIQLGISRAYLNEFQIEDIQPEPIEQGVAGDYIVYEFRRDDPRNPLQVNLKLRPQHYGPVFGRIQLNSGSALEVRQFIMP